MGWKFKFIIHMNNDGSSKSYGQFCENAADFTVTIVRNGGIFGREDKFTAVVSKDGQGGAV